MPPTRYRLVLLQLIKYCVQLYGYTLVLEKRYLCFNSWEQIAVDMNYSIQYCFNIHRNALKKLIRNSNNPKIFITIWRYIK